MRRLVLSRRSLRLTPPLRGARSDVRRGLSRLLLRRSRLLSRLRLGLSGRGLLPLREFSVGVGGGGLLLRPASRLCLRLRRRPRLLGGLRRVRTLVGQICLRLGGGGLLLSELRPDGRLPRGCGVVRRRVGLSRRLLAGQVRPALRPGRRSGVG